MKKTARGFTLVELLVVIAIIAILAVIVAVIINPLEFMRRGRDAARLSDLANLQQAINVAVQDATSSGVAILCSQTGTYPCTGKSNVDGRTSNGTGWVKVNLSSTNMSVPTLPIDSLNTAANHYTYCANNDTWEIDAVLESQQQSGKMATDGGNDPALYEVGSNLSLVAPSGGSCTY